MWSFTTRIDVLKHPPQPPTDPTHSHTHNPPTLSDAFDWLVCFRYCLVTTLLSSIRLANVLCRPILMLDGSPGALAEYTDEHSGLYLPLRHSREGVRRKKRKKEGVVWHGYKFCYRAIN